MKLTAEKLLRVGCCKPDVTKYFDEMGIMNWDAEELLNLAIRNKDYYDASRAINNLMTKKQRVEWSIFCARKVLYIFEEKYPDDDRPRKTIEYTEKYLTLDIVYSDAAADAADAAAADSDYASAASSSAAAASDAASAASPTFAIRADCATYTAATAEKKHSGKDIYPALLRKGAEILSKDEKL